VEGATLEVFIDDGDAIRGLLGCDPIVSDDHAVCIFKVT
jgi:hypothetical protein